LITDKRLADEVYNKLKLETAVNETNGSQIAGGIDEESEEKQKELVQITHPM
jgi:hypothetical protein